MAGVGSFLTMVLGALLGKCGALLLRLEPPYSKIFILSTTFGNATWIFWSSRATVMSLQVPTVDNNSSVCVF